MRTYFFLNHFFYFSYTQAYMVVTIKSGLLGLLSGRTEKYSPCHLVIMTSNPDNATSILGWEPWGVKLGRVLREGWHTPSIHPSIHSCQLQQHSCVEVGGWRFPLCVCAMLQVWGRSTWWSSPSLFCRRLVSLFGEVSGGWDLAIIKFGGEKMGGLNFFFFSIAVNTRAQSLAELKIVINAKRLYNIQLCVCVVGCFFGGKEGGQKGGTR